MFLADHESEHMRKDGKRQKLDYHYLRVLKIIVSRCDSGDRYHGILLRSANLVNSCRLLVALLATLAWLTELITELCEHQPS
jgi:hypothetical protein